MTADFTTTLCRRLAGSVIALAALGVGAMGVSPPSRSAEVNSEDAVKAAFIYRFAGYVDWPKPKEPIDTFTIAVMGSREVASRLEALVANRTLHGRTVVVRRISGLQELGNAQILYIGPTHLVQLKYLVQAVGARNILVVTDEPRGLDAGSAINLLTVDQRVRFEVSTEAARRAGLKIGSELLSVAVRVQGSRAAGELANK